MIMSTAFAMRSSIGLAGPVSSAAPDSRAWPAVGGPRGFDRLIGESEALRCVVQKARRLAELDASVLLQGETGVGKEVFARAIHESGPRRQGPFIAVNCGGLPRDLMASELFGYVDGAFTGARRSGMVGKIEAAHGGTLFLDEIGEMPLEVQPYFLRALEGGEVCPVGSNRPRQVQFRLIAASNKVLRAEVNAARFRADLFYRVSLTSLHVPSLLERREDISVLMEHFSREAVRRHGIPVKSFDPEVVAAFENHSWPGNVRELRNAVETMVLLAEDDVVGFADLPVAIAPLAGAQADEPAAGLEGVERVAIAGAIRKHGGNLTRTSRDLRISKSTLYLKIKKYALEPTIQEARPNAR
jgi:transcriptional regulator with PAS, ATPase and Fis domain